MSLSFVLLPEVLNGVFIDSAKNPTLRVELIWLPEGAQPGPLPSGLKVEFILPIDVNVFTPCGPNMQEIFTIDGVPF